MNVRGSRKARRRRRALDPAAICGCWHCLPSKAKLNASPRCTRERRALKDALR